MKSGVLKRLQSQGCNVFDLSSGKLQDIAETARSTSKLLSNSMVPYLRSAVYDSSQESMNGAYVSRSLYDAVAIANTYQTINNTRVYDYTELLDLMSSRLNNDSKCYVLFNDVIHLMSNLDNKYRILSDYERYRDLYMERVVSLYDKYDQKYCTLVLSEYGNDLDQIAYKIVNKIKANL